MEMKKTHETPERLEHAQRFLGRFEQLRKQREHALTSLAKLEATPPITKSVN
jgi:hypothetical protein